MNSKIEGSYIYNATIICHENILSAAYLNSGLVELYGRGFTVRIETVNEEEAQRIFKHFNIDWHYEIPPSI